MYIPYFSLILLALCVVSCGKKGPVEPLEQSNYPRTYPKPIEVDIPPKKDVNEVEK